MNRDQIKIDGKFDWIPNRSARADRAERVVLPDTFSFSKTVEVNHSRYFADGSGLSFEIQKIKLGWREFESSAILYSSADS